MKIEALQKAGLEHDWITFVPVDFEQETWVEKLIENGFDTSKMTFFLWESVTPYLSEEAVKQTLHAVATSSGKDSVIAFDFGSKAFITGNILKTASKFIESGLTFGIDHTANPRETIEDLLKEAGLSLGEFSLRRWENWWIGRSSK